MTDKPELLPCPNPWCGPDTRRIIIWEPYGRRVVCTCGVKGPISETRVDNTQGVRITHFGKEASAEAEAIAAWNARTPPKAEPTVEGDETSTNPVVSQNAPDLLHKAAPQEGKKSYTKEQWLGDVSDRWPNEVYLSMRDAEFPLDGGEWESDPSKLYEKPKFESYTLTSAAKEVMAYMEGDLSDARIATARNEALEEAAEIAGTLQNTPMPKQFKKKYNETAIWGAGADNHAAKIRLSIRALRTPEGEV